MVKRNHICIYKNYNKIGNKNNLKRRETELLQSIEIIQRNSIFNFIHEKTTKTKITKTTISRKERKERTKENK